MKKTTEALAAQAAKDAMKETEKLCKRAGLTRIKVLKRIKEGLDAHIVKASLIKGTDQFAYSKKLIDHTTRLKSAEMASVLLNMKPAEKKEISGNLTMNHDLSPELNEMFEKIYGKGK